MLCCDVKSLWRTQETNMILYTNNDVSKKVLKIESKNRYNCIQNGNNQEAHASVPYWSGQATSCSLALAPVIIFCPTVLWCSHSGLLAVCCSLPLHAFDFLRCSNSWKPKHSASLQPKTITHLNILSHIHSIIIITQEISTFFVSLTFCYNSTRRLQKINI